MIEPEPEYITPDEAAMRLEKSASQVRRDARSQLVNSIRKGGRIYIRVDERFLALERDPSTRFPVDSDSAPPSVSDTPSLDRRGNVDESERPDRISEELIDEIAELRADVARLTARIRKLEARG